LESNILHPPGRSCDNGVNIIYRFLKMDQLHLSIAQRLKGHPDPRPNQLLLLLTLQSKDPEKHIHGPL
ncbi:MAG: hypothetical protein QF619_13925, partial [Candidatus Binatia bacterium]|nr:hypothetical protein [Candidatus Binatia bacterium]